MNSLLRTEVGPTADQSPPRSVRGRWILVEALLWTFGFLTAQLFVLVGLLAVLLLSGFGARWPGQEEIVRWVLETDLDRSFLLIGAPVLGAVLILLPVVRLREGRNFRQRIGWRTPTTDEVVISLATVCPIALIGNLIYEQVNVWWQSEPMVAWTSATALNQNSLDHLYSTFQGVPYPVLIVAMALAPAFAEELVFRGVLGRRLVDRFGIFQGVLLSSCCFAFVHGSLPHAVATLPVAVLLHLLYIQTGTIWIPVLVHFGNNLLAISMVHFQLNSASPVSPMLLCSLSIYLIMMLVLLSTRTGNLKTREQFALPGTGKSFETGSGSPWGTHEVCR